MPDSPSYKYCIVFDDVYRPEVDTYENVFNTINDNTDKILTRVICYIDGSFLGRQVVYEVY